MKKWNEEMAIESIHIMLIDHEYVAACEVDGTSTSNDVINSRGKILQAIQKLVKKVQGIEDTTELEEPEMKLVGTLTKAWGIKGMEKCEIGHPVYQKKDRYILVMDSIDKITIGHQVTFDPVVLGPWVKPIDK